MERVLSKTGVAKLMGLAVMAGVLMAAGWADSPVADAAMKGDLAQVEALLGQGADVNAAQGDGMTALHWAAERGQADIARMVLAAGADVGAVTRIGQYTPLHLAARNGSLEVATMILDAGAEVMGTTVLGQTTPLHLAASSGVSGVVALLLERGATPDAREAEWGQTPLMFAAALDRADAVRVLIEHGADPNLQSDVLDLTKEGELQSAAGDIERDLIEAFRANGQTPTPAQIQSAVIAARALYLSGEVPEKEEEEEEDNRFRRERTIKATGGLTPLLHAARQGHLDAARALLDGGADIDQASAADGTSPLLMASINGQFDLAMMLIERGADPNIVSELNGVGPLWAAVNAQWQPRTRFPQPQERGLQHATYLDVMEALLEAGAEPNVRTTLHPWYMVYTGCGNGNCGLADTQGSTPFWRAAYATDIEAMRLLHAWGADPNIPTLAPAPRQPRTAGGPQAGPRGQQADVPDSLKTDDPVVENADEAAEEVAEEEAEPELDPSGLPPVPEGGPGIYPLHAASGVKYGEGFAGNAHRHAPNGWMPSVKYLIEELGADVNARDNNGYNAIHHAASRGDNDLILYLVEKGGDVTAISRRGQTTADMANGPVSRVSPFPKTVALLESLGSKNNHNCLSCQ